MTTAASPIILVDQYTGYDGEHDNQNGGVHPAETGEEKIATKWNEALVPILSQPVILPAIVVTTVAPTPAGPVVTATPQPTQTLSADRGNRSVPGHRGGLWDTLQSVHREHRRRLLTGDGRRVFIETAVGSSKPAQPFQKWSPAGLRTGGSDQIRTLHSYDPPKGRRAGIPKRACAGAGR